MKEHLVFGAHEVNGWIPTILTPKKNKNAKKSPELNLKDEAFRRSKAKKETTFLRKKWIF